MSKIYQKNTPRRENPAKGKISGLKPIVISECFCQKFYPFVKKYAGFTLIELLVVVLIIGILAAMAYPSYQMAVYKARVNKDFALLRALKESQERRYKASGSYAKKFAGLDMAIPTPQRTVSDGGFIGAGWPGETAYYSDFAINLYSNRGFIYARRTLPDGIIMYGMRLDMSQPWVGDIICAAYSEMANGICEGLGGEYVSRDPFGKFYKMSF